MNQREVVLGEAGSGDSGTTTEFPIGALLRIACGTPDNCWFSGSLRASPSSRLEAPGMATRRRSSPTSAQGSPRTGGVPERHAGTQVVVGVTGQLSRLHLDQRASVFHECSFANLSSSDLLRPQCRM